MQLFYKNHNPDLIVLHPMCLICTTEQPIKKTFKIFRRKFALHCIDFYQSYLKLCRLDLFYFKDKIFSQSDSIKMLPCRKPCWEGACHRDIMDGGTHLGQQDADAIPATTSEQVSGGHVLCAPRGETWDPVSTATRWPTPQFLAIPRSLLQEVLPDLANFNGKISRTFLCQRDHWFSA